MKEAGIDMENAFKYFDDDNSGVISRGELVEGFKMMKVTMPQKLIETLFVFLIETATTQSH
jgi:Ca2+-binding EF-hand superfamily protein